MEKISKSKNFLTKTFAIFTILLSFALCLALADFFSSLIAIHTFKTTQTTATKIGSYSVWAISLYNSTILSSVNEYAISIKKMGGAGFIWNTNEEYFCFASAYSNQNDADLVKTTLLQSGLSPKIIKLDFSEITINSSYSQNQTSTLFDCLNIFNATYKSLYDISISLDTALLTEANAKLELSTLSNKVNNTKSNFETVFSNKLSNALVFLKMNLQSVYDLTSELVSFAPTSTNHFSSKIKYNYFSILELNKKLCGEFSSL